MARKFPREVLYGPALYKGCDINHPYYTQGITKMLSCVQECAIGSQTKSLIKTLAEELMLEIGIPMTLGSVDWEVAKEYITPCWYAHLAKFILSQALEIREILYRTPLLRQSDQYVMLGFIPRRI